MVYRGLYSYRSVITIFPNFFFLLFLHVERFCKSFWKESLTCTSSSFFHNAARALSSLSRCFQLSTNLGKDFFRSLWYCGLTWHWWNSTDLGLIDMFLINLNAEIVACILSFRKSRHKPNLEKKMAAFWACACKLSWTLLSPARVQPLYGAGRKASSGTGLELFMIVQAKRIYILIIKVNKLFFLFLLWCHFYIS